MKGGYDMKSKFLQFATSSFMGFLIDYALFCGLSFLFPDTENYILLANAAARVVSAICNYTINCRLYLNTILADFCMIFAAIYEYFSHQVYSSYMIGAFLFPVALGIVPDILRKKKHRKVGTCDHWWDYSIYIKKTIPY